MITAPDRLLHLLEWRVVRRLDGRIQGGYRTPRRGSGLDFAGLRPYVEGDDARHIDWNVTARLDEPQVREFNEDRELTTWLVLDRSASMVVGGPGRGKQDVLPNSPSSWPGCSAEAATGSAPCSTTRGTSTGIVPPGTGRGHALRIGRELDRAPDSRAAATTDLAAMLDTVASLARRCLVVVISDFIGTGEWQRPLIRLAHRNEVVALRVVDARGRRPPGGRSDRGRGRRDRRAAPRRLRRSVVPRPVPRRGRRAGGRTSVRHAPGRGAAAPRRHRQRPRRDAPAVIARHRARRSGHPSTGSAAGDADEPFRTRRCSFSACWSPPRWSSVPCSRAGAGPLPSPQPGSRWPAGATARSGCGSSWAGSCCWRSPWPGRPPSLPVGRSAGTVILAMDVSNSMSADDVAPSRLAAAQQAALGVHRRPARHRRHRRGRVRPGCADHVAAQRGSRRGEGGGAEPADRRRDLARLGHPRFAERDHRQVRSRSARTASCLTSGTGARRPSCCSPTVRTRAAAATR